MPLFNPNDPHESSVDSFNEDYNLETAKKDPQLLRSIKRYYGNVEEQTFKDDDEAFNYFVGDRRWKDSNTWSTLKELNRLKGGWGSRFLAEQDIEDLAVIRDRWERLPGVFSPKRGTGLLERAGALAENIGKGSADPTILLAGVGGKAAGAVAGKVLQEGAKKALITNVARLSAGIAIDAAVSAGGNVAFQKANVELGLQEKVDPWSAVVAGGIGGLLSTPGHLTVATHGDVPLPNAKLALTQAQEGAEKLKKEGIGELFTPSERERMSHGRIKDGTLPIHEDIEPQYPTGTKEVNLANTVINPMDINQTLTSKLGIHPAKLVPVRQRLFDYVSGKIYDMNGTAETVDFVKDFRQMLSSDEALQNARIGKTTYKQIRKDAEKGLRKTGIEDSVEAIKGLPKGYAGTATEQEAVHLTKLFLLDKLRKINNFDEYKRINSIYNDIHRIYTGMRSETGRALGVERIRQYAPLNKPGLFDTTMKSLKKASKSLSGAAPENEMSIVKDIQEAIDTLLTPDPKTGYVDPLKVDLFLANMENQSVSKADKLWEVWYNSLLSGPSTQTINLAGNTWTTLIQSAEYLTAHALDEGGSPTQILTAYPGVLKEAAQTFWTTFKTEIPKDIATRIETKESHALSSWDITFGGTPDKLLSFRKTGVGEGGWGGRQVRLPGRFLMAMDDMFKVIHYRVGITDAAIREVVEEQAKTGIKLTKQQFQEAIQNKITNPSTAAHDYGTHIGRTLTFTTTSGPIARSIQQIADAVPGGRLIVPFIRTPANIIKYTADMLSVPFVSDKLSTLRTAEDFAAGGMRKNQAIARMSMGYGLVAAGAALAMEGKAVGGGPIDPAERNTWMANNLPWSLKFGNTQIQYNRLDPVAIPFAIGAGIPDIFRAMNDSEREASMIEVTTKLFSDAILDKTWFQGVQNVMLALQDAERGGDPLINSVARTFVPSIVAASARAYDPRVTAPQTFMEVIQDRIGFDAREKVATKVDVYGREVPVEVLGASKDTRGITGFAARLISPVKTKTDTDPVTAEVDNLRIGIAVPSKKWHNTQLTDDQYYVYSKARGRYIYDGVKYLMSQPGWSSIHPGEKRLLIQEYKRAATKFADLALVGTYPEILDQRLKPENIDKLKEFTVPTREELDESIYSPNVNPAFERMKQK